MLQAKRKMLAPYGLTSMTSAIASRHATYGSAGRRSMSAPAANAPAMASATGAEPCRFAQSRPSGTHAAR